ncbi:hypothetical protein OUZ56_009621 [Daphnia magna]|uniref:Uncharacterized protein n=1 Tax=Daphnia magna TaxID=35525 RepID=A0ABR0AGL0_9CRUS|nr:hypothetical protein OUZ56_009621 [Daphnia magna]
MKFLRYQTCLLSVADKNWRAPLSARQFPLQHPFLSATEIQSELPFAHHLVINALALDHLKFMVNSLQSPDRL